MITSYTLKPLWTKCGLNPKILIIVGTYHNEYLRYGLQLNGEFRQTEDAIKSAEMEKI